MMRRPIKISLNKLWEMCWCNKNCVEKRPKRTSGSMAMTSRRWMWSSNTSISLLALLRGPNINIFQCYQIQREPLLEQWVWQPQPLLHDEFIFQVEELNSSFAHNLWEVRSSFRVSCHHQNWKSTKDLAKIKISCHKEITRKNHLPIKSFRGLLEVYNRNKARVGILWDKWLSTSRTWQSSVFIE